MFPRSSPRPPLTAAKIDEILKDEYGGRLERRGFTPIRRRSWIRSTKASIREEVGIGALKGYTLAPRWSISLDFVPHVTKTMKIQWHRTEKWHVADLGVDPLDQPAAFDLDRLMVSGMATPARFRKDLGRSADLAVRYAEEWFARITDVASLVSLYEEAEHRPVRRLGFDSYPQYQLGFAFVVAHAGELQRARTRLDRWCDLHLHDQIGRQEERRKNLRDRLHALLEQAADTTSFLDADT